MNYLKTSVGNFGPFISIMRIEDKKYWDCDGIQYYDIIVGDAEIADHNPDDDAE